MNFQMFSDQTKIPFLGAFGWFFGHNSPKYSQIHFKFGTVMQANILHQIYYGFWYSTENSKKLTQKPHFVVGIQNFFDHAFFCPMDDAPIFGLMKGLMEIHNPGKFHRYSICGCQVMYFQSLLYQQKVVFLATFGWFLVDYNPKSNLICTKFSPVIQCNAK